MMLKQIVMAIVCLFFILGGVVMIPIVLMLLSIGAIVYVTVRWAWRRWVAFIEWYQRMYMDGVWRERHRCEEDARRLGALKLPEWPNQ